MGVIIRQSVGIDIAKSSFTACICKSYDDCGITFSEVLQFENTKAGFNQFLKWVRKHAKPEPAASFVMEATGIYYEPLAYHLNKLHCTVSVLLPNKVKHYAKSLNIKSKTDIIDARVIAQLGAERSLETWQPPAPVFKQLRDLTRLYSDLKTQRTGFKNRLTSIQSGNDPLPFIIRSTQSIIDKIDKEIERCQVEIEQLIAKDASLSQKVEKLQTIKGVGLITIAIVVAETQGFKLIRNSRQLTSYAGYDIVERESGTSVKGKARISKKGNSRIRAALHFPALVASRYNPGLQAVYTRINEKKKSKMVGVIALQRKILVLLYSLWKNDTVYQPGFTSQPPAASKNKKTGRPTSLPAQDDLKTIV